MWGLVGCTFSPPPHPAHDGHHHHALPPWAPTLANRRYKQHSNQCSVLFWRGQGGVWLFGSDDTIRITKCPRESLENGSLRVGDCSYSGQPGSPECNFPRTISPMAQSSKSPAHHSGHFEGFMLGDQGPPPLQLPLGGPFWLAELRNPSVGRREAGVPPCLPPPRPLMFTSAGALRQVTWKILHLTPRNRSSILRGARPLRRPRSSGPTWTTFFVSRTPTLTGRSPPTTSQCSRRRGPPGRTRRPCSGCCGRWTGPATGPWTAPTSGR